MSTAENLSLEEQNTTENLISEPLQSFDTQTQKKQRLIFDGYFRLHITPQIDNITIPQDIISLLYQYYAIQIALLIKTKNPDSPLNYFNDTILNQIGIDIFTVITLLQEIKAHFIAYDMITYFLQSNPDSAELHAMLANVLTRWNYYSEAESEYDIAIRLDPKNNAIKYKFGGLFIKQHKHDLALKQFLNASKNEPQEPEFYFEAAYCYQMLKQFDNAKENYNKCIEINPNRAAYYEYYADWLCSDGIDLKQSEEYFEKAVKLDVNRWHIYYTYARCLRDYFRNYEKSNEMYLKAIELNPNKGFIHGSYGYLLYLMGEYNEALIYLDKAICLDPDRQFTHYYKSLLFRKLNCELEAEKALLDAVNVVTIPKAVLRTIEIMKKVNPGDIENHRQFEILVRAKCTAMTNNDNV